MYRYPVSFNNGASSIGFFLSFQVNFPPGPVLFWTFLFFLFFLPVQKNGGNKRMVETPKFNIIFFALRAPFLSRAICFSTPDSDT
jgi:hypothetical protein